MRELALYNGGNAVKIQAHCHFCRCTKEVEVIKIHDYGDKVSVETKCYGTTYLRGKPHPLFVAMGLRLWQTLRAKYGVSEEEIP